MKKWISFGITLVEECLKDDVISLSYEITYKLVLAIFPFIIFLMTLLSFFRIDPEKFINSLTQILPQQVGDFLVFFINQINAKQSMSLLSISIIVAVFSASSGFYAAMRGINRAYGTKETRGYIHSRIISMVLVLVFAFSIAISLVVITMGDSILDFVERVFGLSTFYMNLFGFAGMIIAILILIGLICSIYILGGCKRVKILDVLPGAMITAICWIVASRLFGIYVEVFSSYSIYGAVGSLFILLIWLNIIAFILVVGTEINAVLDDKSEKNIKSKA